MQQIGTLKRLCRYPVKSMAGEDLTEACVTFSGILGDRVYAFLDTQNKSDSPWMTARQGPEMILFRPRWLRNLEAGDEIPSAEQYAMEVITPGGEKFQIGDQRFARHFEKRFGHSVRLRFSERSMIDSRPISILGLNTLRALSEETGIELDPQRFRENFYVEWEDSRPFFEDQLVGSELRIREKVTLAVVKKNVRCMIITLDPETAKRSPQVLERVARTQGNSTGVYGAVLREGIVRANDPIYAI